MIPLDPEIGAAYYARTIEVPVVICRVLQPR